MLTTFEGCRQPLPRVCICLHPNDPHVENMIHKRPLSMNCTICTHTHSYFLPVDGGLISARLPARKCLLGVRLENSGFELNPPITQYNSPLYLLRRAYPDVQIFGRVSIFNDCRVIVSSSTNDKIFEITLFTEIGTKFTLFTKIGTKFSKKI